MTQISVNLVPFHFLPWWVGVRHHTWYCWRGFHQSGRGDPSHLCGRREVKWAGWLDARQHSHRASAALNWLTGVLFLTLHSHNDIMTWTYFPQFWLFMKGKESTGHQWIPSGFPAQRASNAELSICHRACAAPNWLPRPPSYHSIVIIRTLG